MDLSSVLIPLTSALLCGQQMNWLQKLQNFYNKQVTKATIPNDNGEDPIDEI